MNDTIPLTMRRLTPEEVLAFFNELGRCYSTSNTSEPFLRLDMTAEEFRFETGYTNDISGDPPLGEWFNECFGTNIPVEEWDKVVQPERERTLRDIFSFIAARASVPEIRPYLLLGRECLSAGAFLTIRTLLARAGIGVTRLGPSSPLEPYLRNHCDVVVREVAKLAPGTLPPLKSNSHAYGMLTFLFALAGIPLVCCPIWSPWVNFLGMFIAFGSPLFLYAVQESFVRNELVGLYDFRDLVDTMLRRPLRPRTPVPQS